jgi:glycosyltransferase involved in cell wall biosynthesis
MECSSVPFFSVIIPKHGPRSPLFDSCLKSVLAQSISDYECLVICDDSQGDSSPFIEDNHIKYIKTDPCTVGAARNLGLEKAKGRYIIFLDADDGLSPFLLERAKFLLKDEDDAVLWFAETKKIDSLSQKADGVEPLRISGSEVQKIFFSIFVPEDSHLRFSLKYGVCWGKAFSASLIRQYNVKFPDYRGFGEDVAFTSAYALHEQKLLVDSSFVGYLHRIVAGSVVHQKELNLASFNNYADTMKNIFKETDNPDFYLERLPTVIVDMIVNWCISSWSTRKTSFRSKRNSIKSAFTKKGALVSLLAAADKPRSRNKRFLFFLFRHRLFSLAVLAFDLETKKMKRRTNKE